MNDWTLALGLPVAWAILRYRREARAQAVGKSIGRQVRDGEEPWATVVAPPRPDWIDDVLRRANDNGTEDESA